MGTGEICSCRIKVKIKFRPKELAILLLGEVKKLLAFLVASVLSERGGGEVEVGSL